MAIDIFFCGDIFINDPSSFCMDDDLKSFITKADYAICNLEGPIKSSGKPIQKAGPHLFQNPLSIKILKSYGFTHFVLANNHIYDFGEEGIIETINEIKSHNLDFIGGGLNWDEAYSLKVLCKNDIKVGVLAFCEAEFGALSDRFFTRGGYAWINHDSVDSLIKESKQKVDKLIVLVHAGIEQIDIPLPEWRQRYKEIIKLGADIIIGGHPHVPHGFEIFEEKRFIYYSLGNFSFDGYDDSEFWNKGIALRLNIDDNYNLNIEQRFIKRDGKILKNDYSKGINHHFSYLNSLLLEENYYSYLNKVVDNLWENNYKRYYQDAFNSLNDKSFLQILKTFIKIRLTRRETQVNESLLLHNLKIESHRWVVERYLNNRIERIWN